MSSRPLRRPLGSLLVTALAAATLALLPTAAAQAAVPTGPSAIAVSSTGISYVGSAAGGTLTRVDASGAVLAPLALPRSGPVDGLAVDAADNVWVSYGTGASQISPSGAELAYVPYPGVTSCAAADGTADPTRYGGIAVSSSYLYVASRCGAGVQRFGLSGTPATAVTTPARARGIAFGVAQNGQPAKVYVASPDTGQVLVYNETLTSLVYTLDVPQTGSSAPSPSGVAVDRYGQLAVADAAADRVLLFDTNNVQPPRGYGFYRQLGRTGANAGDLANPTALAQYPVDGPLQDRRGDFFVADTGNGRIQRWNTSGYTYWTAAVGGSGGGGTPTPTAPVNTVRPVVSGTPAVGRTLSCSNGSWSGSPTSYVYGWNRNGSSISGQSSNQYVVQAADAGQGISCFVRASNAAGQGDYATSDAVAIGSGPTTPPDPTSCSGVAETVSVNGGSAYTNDAAVTLTIVPAPGATRVLVSNDGGFAGATPQALSSSCSYPWTLSTTGGKATRVVYVRFLDDAGATVGRASDDIILDTSGPAVSTRSSVVRSGSRYVVSVVSTDQVSGVATIQYAATRGGRGGTVAYRSRLVTRSPASFAWVRTYDRAGNVSAWVRTVRR